MIIMSLFSIFIGFSGLYISSEKQKNRFSKSVFSLFLKYRAITRITAFSLFGLAIYFLIQYFETSIGFWSFWIFSTPIIFLIILFNTTFRKMGQ